MQLIIVISIFVATFASLIGLRQKQHHCALDGILEKKVEFILSLIKLLSIFLSRALPLSLPLTQLASNEHLAVPISAPPSSLVISMQAING